MEHQNPSYLGGLAEIEPHYFKPTTPEYLQTMVSNTPFDRGDGVPVVHPPQLTTQQQYLSGNCAPCAQVRNPIAMAGAYGVDWSKFGTGENIKNFLDSMSEEDKAQIKGGALSAASMLACEKFGILCPEIDDSGPAPVAKPPITLYVLVGLGFAGMIGTIIYVSRSRNSAPRGF